MKAEYRKDVQGIRAIGISLVVIFHIWVGRVSGGVDVFFVISSYLMTSSLISSFSKTGKIDVVKFWGRVCLRILPTAALVILATLIIGSFVIPRPLWQAFSSGGLNAALQLTNIRAVLDAANYLDRGSPASPFQQFWALSTQMQFYGLLPLLIWGCALFSRKTPTAEYNIKLHLVVMTTLGVLSFALAVWLLARNPGPHYFNPFARVWEFMVGAVCASVSSRVKFKGAIADVMGWLGLALIVSCGFVMPVSAPFPGFAALWPVTGAALILLMGNGGASPRGVGVILSTPPLQYAAALSFTVYLCHWPMLVFAQELLGTTKLSLFQGLSVIAAAITMAALTKVLVEDPFRRLPLPALTARAPKWAGWALPFAISGALLAPTVVFAKVWNHYFSAVRRDYIASAKPPAHLGRIVAPDRQLPSDIERQLISNSRYLPRPYSDGCNQKPKATDVVVCTYGNHDPKAYTIVLVGGSHSVQWHPALEDIARRHGFRLLNITKSACAFNGAYIGPDVISPAIPSCRTWAKNAASKIVELNPDLVFTTATRPGPKNVGDYIPDDYKSRWKTLTDQGIPVVAIRDNPRPEFFQEPLCIDRNRSNLERCDLDRASHLSVPNPLSLNPPTTPLLKYIDLSDYICGPTTCPAMVKGVMIYNDNSHLSVPFVQSVTPALERDLLRAIAELKQPA